MRRLLIILGVLVLVAAAAYGGLWASTGRSQLARAFFWGDSDVGDWQRFPFRKVSTGTPAPLPKQPQAIPGLDEQALAAGQTTAFVVVRDGKLLYEGYFNGTRRDSTLTSMSVAKSVLSLLVGVAVGEGKIRSADDPITAYVPELRERDPRFEKITLRHLMGMRSGLRYDDEGTPFSDDTSTYYSPDLRGLAIDDSGVESDPGQGFRYNNFNPLLVGLALERTTKVPVATYLEQKLWRPLGMEADGSWSLDSSDGFEKMESGVNGRAVDFAKLGMLVAEQGRWNGQQLVPAEWINEPNTPVVAPNGWADGYQLFWWARGEARVASGRYGQVIYVVPDKKLVMVRFGVDTGGRAWPAFMESLAEKL
ncbi:serine hydrolase domain-containing protein [Nonomuraea sp. NPDC050547]|uniref:serine hydrolase domain-containing protein n=1 Tax=Nonomuraea sp. NPDC050547 TaxID=3364368 RepID=UPI0037B603AA